VDPFVKSKVTFAKNAVPNEIYWMLNRLKTMNITKIWILNKTLNEKLTNNYELIAIKLWEN